MFLKDLGPIEIQACMKNRYPFFMLDRITEVQCSHWAKGYKNFTNNEWFFQGHFQDNPNVPGAIQLEVMIEVFIMIFLTDPKYKGMETADSTVSALRFFEKVYPGDRLECVANLQSFRRGVGNGSVEGFVKGKKVCSCNLVVCIPEIINEMKPKL